MLQTFIQKAKGAALMTLLSAVTLNSNAATFTAVASGNFDAAATWGGVAPGSLLTSDVIIIPAGLTVTLTDAVTFSGTSSLTVLGSLNSVAGGNLIMTSGDLSGAGSIDVDSLSLGLTSGVFFAGNITAEKMTSTGTNVSSAANIYVRKMLLLASGTLDMASGKLSLAENATVTVDGGALAYSSPGILNLDSTYTVVYTGSAASTGLELYGPGLDSVVIDVSGTLNLSDDVELNGALNLSSGMFSLNNKSLTLGADADLYASGTGTISGSSFSNLTIKTNGSLSGALKFTSGSNVLNNLTINMVSAGASVKLGSSVNVNGTLTLLAGKIVLGANNLSLKSGANITGGSANSFVVADGFGSLIQQINTGANATFTVGTNTDYTPIMIAANTASVSSDVGVSVNGSVMADGTSGSVLSSTQPMVRNTWFITSSVLSGINFDITPMWSASLEVNAFNRMQAYVSHYTAGNWDVTAPGAATSVSGGLYSITRTGITSLSPFMVTDKDAVTTSVGEFTTANSSVSLYPSPANDMIFVKSTRAIDQVSIFNMEGKLIKTVSYQAGKGISVNELPSGFYIVHLNGANMKEMKKIQKQ